MGPQLLDCCTGWSRCTSSASTRAIEEARSSSRARFAGVPALPNAGPAAPNSRDDLVSAAHPRRGRGGQAQRGRTRFDLRSSSSTPATRRRCTRSATGCERSSLADLIWRRSSASRRRPPRRSRSCCVSTRLCISSPATRSRTWRSRASGSVPGDKDRASPRRANRDPERFPDPDRLDPARDPNPHADLRRGRPFLPRGAPARGSKWLVALPILLRAPASASRLAEPAAQVATPSISTASRRSGSPGDSVVAFRHPADFLRPARRRAIGVSPIPGGAGVPTGGGGPRGTCGASSVGVRPFAPRGARAHGRKAGKRNRRWSFPRSRSCSISCPSSLTRRRLSK